MDDDFDILSLAIESVENESDSKLINENDLPESGSTNNTDQNQEKETVPGEKSKFCAFRSLVGVDLDFSLESFESPEKVPVVEKVPVKKKQDNLLPEKSLVHTGDTDSSDDEDNKYFEERKYDSFGKFIKSKLKVSENSSLKGHQDSSWKKKTNDTIPDPISKVKVVSDVSADPIFGIRIINPLVSSQVITEKMVGRTPVSFAKIKSHVAHGDLKNDWVIAAVIVKKLPPRVSQNGNNYSSWVLSDLKNDLKTVFLFLFGKAHQELWKTAAGSVLAILNPSVLSDNKSEYEAKLSIKSPDQVMIWGRSKDLGQCKVIKKNGEMCGAFVNSYLCEVCVYHVKQEYNKCSSRPQFSSQGNVNLRNKVLGKNEVFYGGKSFTAIPPSGSKKKMTPKDATRIKGLGGTIIKTPEIVSIPNLQRSNEILKLLPSVNNPLNNHRPSDRNRLAKLSSDGTNKDICHNMEKNVPENGITSTKQPGKNYPHMKNSCSPDLSTLKATTPGLKLPTLSNPESDFLLNEKCNFAKEKSSVPSTIKSDKKINSVPQKKNKINLQKRFNNLVYLSPEIKEEKRNAIVKQPEAVESYLKPETVKTPLQNIEVESFDSVSKDKKNIKRISNSNKNIEEKCIVDENREASQHSPKTPIHNEISSYKSNASISRTPTTVKSQNSSSTMSRAKMKALLYVKSKGPINKENPNNVKSEGKSTGVKRPFPSEEEEGGENKKTVLSERFIQLMNQKSLHEDLVELREYEQEMEYFEKMEKKDRLEEKMLSTYKVDCKAVKCLKCNYLWFSAAEACKAEGHPLKVIDAVKRFFKCGRCENRTVSLTIIPLLPCKKCSSSSWVRTAMIKEKVAKLDSLSIRGGEQKFFNSVVTNASLNLLVPDD